MSVENLCRGGVNYEIVVRQDGDDYVAEWKCPRDDVAGIPRCGRRHSRGKGPALLAAPRACAHGRRPGAVVALPVAVRRWRSADAEHFVEAT